MDYWLEQLRSERLALSAAADNGLCKNSADNCLRTSNRISGNVPEKRNRMSVIIGCCSTYLALHTFLGVLFCLSTAYLPLSQHPNRSTDPVLSNPVMLNDKRRIRLSDKRFLNVTLNVRMTVFHVWLDVIPDRKWKRANILHVTHSKGPCQRRVQQLQANFQYVKYPLGYQKRKRHDLRFSTNIFYTYFTISRLLCNKETWFKLVALRVQSQSCK